MKNLYRSSRHLFLSGLMPLFILAASSLITVQITQAQNEVERERHSLQGLQEFGFIVNIEGSNRVTSDTTMTVSYIRQQAIDQLADANLRFVDDEAVRSSADIPYLFMHINMLEMDDGLIPFSIQLRLYQPVKLILNRDLQTSASTWENGLVGIVSYDRIHTIRRAAYNLINTFIDDYHMSHR